MDTLFLITARGGSKGVPGKNVKPLMGKPLIGYSIDFARKFASDIHICVSTDSEEIIRVTESYGLKVPFKRPVELASDTSGSREVILHALDFFRKQGRDYKKTVLLQPTSPFRKETDVQEMINIFDMKVDMVVSVKESHDNPYFSLYEETGGYLKLCKKSNFVRRQDCPKVYAFNGSAYVINSSSLLQRHFNEFEKVRKYVMDDIHSIDIDSHFDWLVAEMILEKGLFTNSAKGQ